MRRLWLVLACTALVLAPVSAAAERAVDRGIVVRVASPRLVVRELDGSRHRFVVQRATLITLNGRPVALVRLRRGDVAIVEHTGRFAISIRAFRS